MNKTELGAIRRRLGWTQEQTGVFLGVNLRTVLRWENGQAAVPPATAMLLRLVIGGKVTNADIAETACKVADHAFS